MLEAIKEIVGESRFFTADAIGADYCHDECPGVAGTPDAAAEVTSTEQAAAVVKLCAEAGVPSPCAAQAPAKPVAPSPSRAA